MKIVIAMDSFKGSMTSMEAGEAVREGILRVCPDAGADVSPLSDGGEGTVEALTGGGNGELHTVMATGPVGERVACTYGILRESGTAVIEMAGAAGLTLVPEERRNPLYTTTCGVGEVIKDAAAKGCRKFLVGIGGSATNDGGAGMLQALGFGLLDAGGRPIPFGAGGLESLCEITESGLLPEISDCIFRVACDVNNPLCGENGSSRIFGPQKGADREMVEKMDRWLRRYAILTQKKYPRADPEMPGAGAAGGMGFAFSAFLNASLEPGIDIVLEETGLEEKLKRADLVITGEGRLDGQTAMGKAPVGVARLAGKYGKPVIAFAGGIGEDAEQCNQMGIDAFFSILRNVTCMEEAMKPETARKNLASTVGQVLRLWVTAQNPQENEI